MRFYLLTLSLATLFISPAQAQLSMEKAGYEHTINYPDHKVTLHVQDGEHSLKYTDLTKSYYWYSNNQIKITQGGFSGKLLHGTYNSYYLNRNLQEKGNFKMGLKTGHWSTWTETGVLKSNVSYAAGIPEGRFYKYDERGKLNEEGSYRHGKIQGRLIKYQGDSTQVTRYKNGVLVQPKTKSGKSNWIKGIFKKKTVK